MALTCPHCNTSVTNNAAVITDERAIDLDRSSSDAIRHVHARVSAIVGGWDSEAEMPVDGQVGEGPTGGAGGKASFEDQNIRRGGPGLYMIEPSGLYWVSYLGHEVASFPKLT